MINSAKQLKDLIRNLSKKKSADAQILMRNYMMERFLERVSRSDYRDKIILKGGTLVAALVGVNIRATMDLDATIKGTDVNLEAVERIVTDIASISLEDGVLFHIKQISEIMDEAEYPGVRVSMETEFDGIRVPLKVDISTGDVITPKEIQYSLKLMLEDRSINVLAYNLETLFAEKMETVISRGVTNTRMRDFYDIHILFKLYKSTLDRKVLCEALLTTAEKRGTDYHLKSVQEIFDKVQSDSGVQKLWKSYQKRFPYAAGISWKAIMESVKEVYCMCECKIN